MARSKKPHDDAGQDAHDDREIDVREILRVATLVVTVTVVASGILWFFAIRLRAEERGSYAAPPPIASARSVIPEAPRLQPHPRDALLELRAREDEVLTTYRWMDGSHTAVGIPIDRAIELVVAQPPKSRAPLARGAEPPPISRPTQSSLGAPRAGESRSLWW